MELLELVDPRLGIREELVDPCFGTLQAKIYKKCHLMGVSGNPLAL